MYEVPFVRELCLEKFRNGDQLVGGVHPWSKTGEKTGQGYCLTPWELQAVRFTEAPVLSVPGWTAEDTLTGDRAYNDVRATFGQIGECMKVTGKKEQNRGFDFRFWRGWPDEKQKRPGDEVKYEVKSRSESHNEEALFIQVAEKWDKDVRKLVLALWEAKLKKEQHYGRQQRNTYNA